MKTFAKLGLFLALALPAMACSSRSDEAELDLEPVPEQHEEPNTDKISISKMNISVNGRTLTATLVDNSSTAALVGLLEKGPITINMIDYANFEKVGQLPQSLPSNNEDITTEAGDLILYQGRSFIIYYDTNSYYFTRLGKIDNVTKSELKSILGTGSVTVTLSL